MASFTLSPGGPFRPGETVLAARAGGRNRRDEGTKHGVGDASGLVASTGAVTLTGLWPNTEYVAYIGDREVHFRTGPS